MLRIYHVVQFLGFCSFLMGLYLVAKAPPILASQSARGMVQGDSLANAPASRSPSIQPLSITQVSSGSDFLEIKNAVKTIESRHFNKLSHFMVLHTNVRCLGKDLMIAYYRRSKDLSAKGDLSGATLKTASMEEDFATAFFIFEKKGKVIPLLVDAVDSIIGIENGFAKSDCPPLIGKVIEKSDSKPQGAHWVSIKFNHGKGLYEFQERDYDEEGR
jgi:phosphoribosyl-AMP cyclohydrolase